MKHFCGFLVILSIIQSALAQSKGFEGIIENVARTQYAPDDRKIIKESFKALGREEFAEEMLDDSARIKIYIKGDSLWAETFSNNRKEIRQIYYQVGTRAFIIVPNTGTWVPLGKVQEIESFLDLNTNENWREKVNVNDWFKIVDYSKWKKLNKKTKLIQGFLCNLYRFDDDRPNSVPSYYWIAEEISVGKDQILPYFFERRLTPFGVVLGAEWVSKEVSHFSEVRNLKLGSVAPILPRLQAVQLGELDSLQYADEDINQHLKGKNIEGASIIPDFSFYPVGKLEPVNLYAQRGSRKFMLLDLWATWCGPCIKEFPKLRQLQEENTSVLDLISVNIGDHRDDYVQEFIKKHNMSWAQIYGGRLLRAFLNPKKSIPYVILLDDRMKVRWMGNPSLHWGEIEKIIQND